MFYFDYINNKKILKSDLINEAVNFFTTRESCIYSNDGGYEKAQEKMENFLGAKLATNLPAHGKNIDKVIKGKYLYENTDGLLIENQGCAYLNFGDCVPMIFYCDNVGMIVHAGWRGTALEIGKKAVSKLVSEYRCSPKNIKVVIGPAICMDCYVVGYEIYSKLYATVANHNSGFSEKDGKYFVGLKNINKQQLIESGVTQIDVCPYCTACGEKLFFSYRYENKISKRHSAILKLG